MQQGTHPFKHGRDYESAGANVALLKVLVPFFWLACTVALFKEDVLSIRIIGCVPFLFAFVFLMSLAAVRVRNGNVEYRRLWQWKPLLSADVVSSGVIWPPFIGFLCLRQPLPPWGRLFFVLDTDSARPSSRNQGLGIVGQFQQKQSAENLAGHDERKKVVHYGPLIFSGVCGVLASFLRVYLSQTVAPGTTSPNNYSPPMIEFATRALAYVGNPQLAIPLLIGFVLMAVFFRKRPSSWSFAFLAGVVAPFALFPGVMHS